MNPSKISMSTLLDKLIDIEQSIGLETDVTLRNKTREAQDLLLQFQNSGSKNALLKSATLQLPQTKEP